MPSKLFALILLILSATGAILWVGCLVDTETPAFDRVGLALLGGTLSSFVLSILFLRRAKWARRAASILLHMLILALLVALLLALPMAETATETATIISMGFLAAGLLFAGILGLNSEAMKRDLAGDAPLAPRTHPHRRKFILATVGCLLLLGALAAWRIVPLLVAEPTITVDYLAQANQANKPANYDPNQNAAAHYEKLLSEFIPLPEALKEVWKSWPADLEPNEYKALEEWAPLNEPVVAVLTQAAQCPYSWFEMKSSTGALSGIHIPHLGELRDSAWGGVLMAKFRAHQGDVSGAMQLLTDVHMMGVHRTEGGTLLEQLTGLAVCGLVYNALFAILEHCEVDKDLLGRTFQALAPRMAKINVPRFCEVERLYGLDSIQRAFTDNGKGDGRLIPERLYTTKKNRLSLYTFPISYLDAVKICVTHPGRQETTGLSEAYFTYVPELAKQTPWELHTQDTKYEEQLKELLQDNYYLQDGLAAIGQCIRIGWRSKVTGEATMTVLAVFLYEAQEGRLPVSLKQLVDAHLLPRYPMDPYSGAPLVYRVTADGFTLYSVGEDFVDNDGSPCDWADETGGDQVFWPVPKPKDIMDELKSMYDRQSEEGADDESGEDK
jgi:hypothetical protein